jgi:hypothetical protein
MKEYCTLFDRNYLSRGLALHRSLEQRGSRFRLFVLCLDNPTHEALSALALPHLELISIDTLADWDGELRSARANRGAAEFYFTCKPVLMLYLLARYEGMERITYLDSDLFFFSDQDSVDLAIGDSAVALTPHRFPPRLAHLKSVGEFNAGWISVGASGEGRRFLTWWRSRCLEWCRLIVEETRFGDQKYLDQVPSLFRDVVCVTNPGVNAAPWNIVGRRITTSKKGVEIDGHPLVAYHFHGMKRVVFHLYDSGLYTYGARFSAETWKGIYRPYVQELSRCEALLSRLPQSIRTSIKPALALPGGSGWLYRMKITACILATGTALVGPWGRL